jgi:uncharacterized protein
MWIMLRALSKHLVQAVRWFKFAAEKGDASAVFNLALAYQAGSGVEK